MNLKPVRSTNVVGCSSETESQKIVPTFLSAFWADYIIGPAREHLFPKRRVSDSEEKTDVHRVEQLCLTRNDAPEQVVFSNPLNNGYRTLNTPGKLLCSRIPNVTSQTLRMNLLLLDAYPDRNILRRTVWNGCCSKDRAQIWRMLLDIEPLDYEVRISTLRARRTEYREHMKLLSDFTPLWKAETQSEENNSEVRLCGDALPTLEHGDVSISSSDCDNADGREKRSRIWTKILRQIELDLPRTHPDTPIFHVAEIRNIMRRVLFLYSILNPGKSYMQGMNEIITPLIVVFVNDQTVMTKQMTIENFLMMGSIHDCITANHLEDAEADTFWAFTRIVSLVEDNFISDQPGILRRISRLEEIVRKVDPALAAYLVDIEVEFLQFAYRWLNCLLMRELPFQLVIRVWDALLAEDDGISDLHVYVCAALIIRFSEQLQKMDFEEAILLLQRLPTEQWRIRDVDELLSQAHMWKETLRFESLTSQEQPN